jgi:hypothetical protein
MGEIQASFCTPSQTLVASMTAMQLLDYERQVENAIFAPFYTKNQHFTKTGSGQT